MRPVEREPNIVLSGRAYELHTFLKANNGVETWRGIRHHDRAPIVAKLAPPDRLTPQQAELLWREASVLSGLKSRSYVSLLDYGRHEDRLVLVTSYVSGETLEERAWDSPLAWNEALDLAYQLSSALEELHQLGYIHGDLKPAHVILSNNGPTLCDFGLSYRLEEQMDKPLGGTFLFSAPEQMGLIRAPLSPAADLYSLGRLLCWSLNPALSQTTSLGGVLDLSMKGDLPEVFGEILERLTRTSPNDRYASASGLSYDLKTAQLEPTRMFALGQRDLRSDLVEPSFVGRHDELRQLRTKLEECGTVFLSAYSGMGKSRLLKALGEAYRNEGVVVFEGQAFARQGDVSLPVWEQMANQISEWLISQEDLRGIVRQKLGGHGKVLGQAFPCLREVFGSVPSTAEFGLEVVLESLVIFLKALNESHKIVLLFDDAQWADTFTLRFLKSSPVDTVVAFRTEEVDSAHPLADFDEFSMSLSPLTSRVASELLEAMAGPLPTEALEEICRAAGGEPFLLQSYLRGAVELGMLQASSTGWRWESSSLSVRFDTKSAWRLPERLERLAPNERLYLGIGALLGKDFCPTMVAHLAQATGSEVQSALEFLTSRGLVSLAKDRARFTHDKIREALMGDFAETEKQELHSRAASWLEAQEGAAQRELALHWWQANDPARALPYAVNAAREAEGRLDYPEASSFYRMALEVSVELLPPDQHRELLKSLAASLSSSDDYYQAKDVFKEAIGAFHDNSQERAYLLAGLAEQLSRLNEADNSNRAAEEAFELLGASRADSRVRIAFQIAGMLVELFRRNLQTRSLVPTEDELKRVEICEAQLETSSRNMRFDLFTWCLLRGLLDLRDDTPRPQGARLKIFASQIGAQIGLRAVSRKLKAEAQLGAEFRPRAKAYVTGQSGSVLLFEGDLRGALAQFENAIPLCCYCNDAWNLAVNQHHLALSYYFLGQFESAKQSGRAVLDRQQHGDASNSIAAARVLALVGTGQDYLSAIDRYEEEMRGTVFCSLGFLAKGVVELQRSAWKDAVIHLKQASTKHSAFLGPHTAGCSAWLALAYRCWAEDLPIEALSRRKELLREYARVVQTALRHSSRFPVNQPHALREHAISSAYAGRFYLARSQFEKSFEISERLGMAFESAWTLYERGRFAEVGGWPDWSEDQAEGLARVRELGGWIPGVDLSIPEPQRHLAKLDRFDRVLEGGRRLVLLNNEEQLLEALKDEAKSLLRCDLVRLIRPGQLPGHLSRTLYERCLSEGRAVTEAEVKEPTRSLLLGEARSTLMAPLKVDSDHFAVLVVKQKSIGGFFGEEEMRLADYLCALAGAGLENTRILAQREQTFQALQTSEQRFRGFFEYAGVGTALLDEAGVLIEENPYLTSLLGGSNLGKPLWQLTHASDREALKANFATLHKGESPRYDAEIRLHRAGGEVAWSQSCLVPLPVQQGEQSRYLLTVADTTHRRIAEMMEFLENERRALAAEVHDELAQNLSALHMRLSALKSEDPKIQKATGLAHQLVEDASMLMMSLRNPLAEGVDLIPALKSLVANFSVECEAEIRVDWPEESLALSDLSKLVLYRVLQEGLTNIRKHAKATLVTLEFQRSGHQLQVKLSDNGQGFEAEQWLQRKAARKNFGLLSMRDRVELVGGGFQLESAQSQGTTLVIKAALS